MIKQVGEDAIKGVERCNLLWSWHNNEEASSICRYNAGWLHISQSKAIALAV